MKIKILISSKKMILKEKKTMNNQKIKIILLKEKKMMNNQKIKMIAFDKNE